MNTRQRGSVFICVFVCASASTRVICESLCVNGKMGNINNTLCVWLCVCVCVNHQFKVVKVCLFMH